MVEYLKRHSNVETNARSIVKAVSYRLLGSSVTGLILLILTGKVTLSVIGGAMDMVLKIAAYFVHERIWNHIDFGRSKPPEYEI
jgi:adenylylsulfate kinase